MKSKLNKYLVASFVVLFFFAACKKNDVGLNITGRWAKTQFKGTEQYIFNSDGTFEYDVFASDSATIVILGYRYKMTGKYTTTNSEIKLYNILTFSNPDSAYGPLTALVGVDGSTTAAYNYTLNQDKSKLSFYFTCPPYADCVPSPLVYDRQFSLTQ